MSLITLNLIGNSITGTVNGKSFGVSYSKERYAAMDEMRKKANAIESMDELKSLIEQFMPLTQESYKEVIESKSPYLYVNPANNKFYLKYNKEISKEPIPQAFVDRILESVEKGIDPKPLVKFWARTLRNPNYTEAKAAKIAWYINQTHLDTSNRDKLIAEGVSYERATEISTGYQTPITEEGLLCTYKVSREITKRYVKDEDADGGVKEKERYDYDVDEFSGLKKYKEPAHVEDRFFQPAVVGNSHDAWDLVEPAGGIVAEADTHHIKVGKIHRLRDWKQVNCDDSRTGVKGLHVGNLDYIRCYQREGTVTHEVLVDPMYIGAVVQDGTGALRVKEYMVHRSFAGVNRSIYHSSTYAKLNDEEYAKMVADVVAKTREEAISAANQQFNEKLALTGDAADHPVPTPAQ